MDVELADLLLKAEEYLPKSKLRLLQDAFAFADTQHQGQTRVSGDSYINHPLQTSLYPAGSQSGRIRY